MLYDLMFSLGGDVLVQLTDAIMGPIFGWVCQMPGANWEAIATFLEYILS